MMTAQEARKRSSGCRWTDIESAITRAANDGGTSVTIMHVSDDDAKALRAIGYHVSSGKHRESKISWRDKQ